MHNTTCNWNWNSALKRLSTPDKDQSFIHTITCDLILFTMFIMSSKVFELKPGRSKWLCIMDCMSLDTVIDNMLQLEMLLIPNALCWSSRKCNCACALPAEVQLRLRFTNRSWQKLFAGKNFVKILVTAQTQSCSYSEQKRAFGNSNICNSALLSKWAALPHDATYAHDWAWKFTTFQEIDSDKCLVSSTKTTH